MADDANDEPLLSGVGGSPGTCCGRAVVLFAGQEGGELPPDSGPVILVGQSFTGAEVLAIDAEQVGGFILAAGGVTAPAALVACSVGLPAVLGCADLQRINNGDVLLLDGYRGEVVLNPSAATMARFKQRQEQSLVSEQDMAAHRYLPAETLDGFKLDVLASVHLVDAVADTVIRGASGIGLLRSEFYYLTDDGAPSEEFLFSLYQHVLSLIAPLPVTIRTLDLGGGVQVHGMEQGVEPNSALGLKGIRFSLRHLGLLKTQLRALYRASAFGPLRILLPMIGSLDELLAVKSLIVEVQAELRGEGVEIGHDVELGLAIELVSAVFMAQHLASEVDFFMINLNGLIQYGLAVDRENEAVSHLYDPLHPAVLHMLDLVVKAGHQAGIHVGVGGEMVADSQYVPLFVGFGVDWLTLTAPAIGGIKRMIRCLRADDCVELVHSLVHQSSSQASKRYLREYLATVNLTDEKE